MNIYFGNLYSEGGKDLCGFGVLTNTNRDDSQD